MYSCHSSGKSLDERVPCVVGDMVETIQPDSRPARWKNVEHMVSIIARATCNGQQINGCTRSCRFVLTALSCSWPAGSGSGAAAGDLGSSYRQSCAR